MCRKENTVYVDCYYYKIKVTHEKLLEYNLTSKQLHNADLQLREKYKTPICSPAIWINTPIIERKPGSPRKTCLDMNSSFVQYLYSGSTKLYQSLPNLFSA